MTCPCHGGGGSREGNQAQSCPGSAGLCCLPFPEGPHPPPVMGNAVSRRPPPPPPPHNKQQGMGQAEREYQGKHICTVQRLCRMTATCLGFISAQHISCQQIPQSQGFIPGLQFVHERSSCLRGTLVPRDPGAGDPRPADTLSAMGTGPSATRVHACMHTQAHTHICMHTRAHTHRAHGSPPPAPGTLAPLELSNVSGDELITNTHSRALRVAAEVAAGPAQPHQVPWERGTTSVPAAGTRPALGPAPM